MERSTFVTTVLTATLKLAEVKMSACLKIVFTLVPRELGPTTRCTTELEDLPVSLRKSSELSKVIES